MVFLGVGVGASVRAAGSRTLGYFLDLDVDLDTLHKSNQWLNKWQENHLSEGGVTRLNSSESQWHNKLLADQGCVKYC